MKDGDINKVLEALKRDFDRPENQEIVKRVGLDTVVMTAQHNYIRKALKDLLDMLKVQEDILTDSKSSADDVAKALKIKDSYVEILFNLTASSFMFTYYMEKKMNGAIDAAKNN